MRVLFLLGNAYIQMERRIKADECFQKALKLRDVPLLEEWSSGTMEKVSSGLRKVFSNLDLVSD
jgi:hypothetical protein